MMRYNSPSIALSAQESMRYFYCAKCEKPIDSPNGQHFQTHSYSLSEALRAGLANTLTERDYKRLVRTDERREAKMRAFKYRTSHLLREQEAWAVVVDVWDVLKVEAAKKAFWRQLWMPSIKASGRKNPIFYRALQTVLWDNRSVPDDEHGIIVVAGAPSNVCEKDGLLFSDCKSTAPRLWVYWNIDNEKRARERAVQ